MNERIKRLTKPLSILAVLVFVICYIIDKPQALADYTSYIGYSISAVSILFVAYDRFLWKHIPWNRPPTLKKKYNGVLRYKYGGVSDEKNISIVVKQSWLTISIQAETDINSSVSVAASIVTEYGCDVLYYSYVTSPSAASQETNPIQHGTCRMKLGGDNSRIYGTYWTSSKTIGDIEWTAEE